MITILFLFFTFILLVLGAVCGFNRGILKEGIRTGLWVVLFAVSCFFVPQITDKIILFAAGKFGFTATDVEQMLTELLAKMEGIDAENYLLLPLIGFTRTLVAPVVTILCFWATGLISWIIFLIVSIFLRKATENQGLVSQLTGMLLAIVIALFGGAMSIFPVAQISSSLRQGNISQNITEDFPIAETLETAYEGTLVQNVFKYTGMEAVSNFVHTNVNNQVVLEEKHTIWEELPGIVRFGSVGYDTYKAVTAADGTAFIMETQVKELAEALFDLNFIADEQKIEVLKRVKETVDTSVNNEMLSLLLSAVPMENKEQIISDVSVVGGLYDLLKQEGILNMFLNGTGLETLSENKVVLVLNKLYELSAAEQLVPEFINLFSVALLGEGNEIIQTENLEWNSKTKEDISEAVSFVFRISELLTRMDSMTVEEKLQVAEEIKAMENNTVINKNILADLAEIK